MFDADFMLLLGAQGGLILSSDNPFDFHAEIRLLLAIMETLNNLAETLNNFAFHYFQKTFTAETTRVKRLKFHDFILLCFSFSSYS